MGRHAIPTAIKRVRGNPGCRPLNDAEPDPGEADLTPPKSLSKVGVAKWNNIAPLLQGMRVLTAADVPTLERYCLIHEQWVKILDHVRDHGMTQLTATGYSQITAEGTLFKSLPGELLAIERQFGMTPAARSSLRIESAAPPADPLEAYIKTRVVG